MRLEVHCSTTHYT